MFLGHREVRILGGFLLTWEEEVILENQARVGYFWKYPTEKSHPFAAALVLKPLLQIRWTRTASLLPEDESTRERERVDPKNKPNQITRSAVAVIEKPKWRSLRSDLHARQNVLLPTREVGITRTLRSSASSSEWKKKNSGCKVPSRSFPGEIRFGFRNAHAKEHCSISSKVYAEYRVDHIHKQQLEMGSGRGKNKHSSTVHRCNCPLDHRV